MFYSLAVSYATTLAALFSSQQGEEPVKKPEGFVAASLFSFSQEEEPVKKPAHLLGAASSQLQKSPAPESDEGDDDESVQIDDEGDANEESSP